MQFSPDEKETAKALIQNKSYMQLLHKIFIDNKDRINPDVMLAKTNEELGEIIRADAQAEMKIEDRMNKLKMLGLDYKDKRKPID